MKFHDTGLRLNTDTRFTHGEITQVGIAMIGKAHCDFVGQTGFKREGPTLDVQGLVIHSICREIVDRGVTADH